MMKIPVVELEAGLKYTKPVFVDEENLLVPEGVEVRQKDIDRLIRWGVEEVSTDGEILTGDSGGGEEIENVDSVSKQLLKQYDKAIEAMDSFFGDCRKGLNANKEDIDTVMGGFYPLILENIEEALVLTTIKKEGSDRLSQAAVNNLILSTVLGATVKIPLHRLANIASAALIHDLGMTRIPQDIIKKRGKLTPAELETIKTHTVYAYRMAIKDLGLPEEVGRIAMSHHERWDGKGYPRGLEGNKIPVGARILSVTDAFVAMSKDRPDRDSLLGYTAIRQILNDNSRRFDPAILKVFIKSIGIYPRGSIVILNNGAIGRINRIRSAAPLRPGLQILVDERGRKPKKEKEFVDLFIEKDLFITKPVDPKELVKS
ncbi:MAG: HD-GYP domain-containing protein [Spirochaetales bacterium]|uniref:HD-GYP domain-containing protein n=1 Tax=Candidatus Thalassospirochaeta sargassi TaxID=3119039 RepID=A0AAJ1IDK1_9SPIO|nr:HD-GYP domain-containing protein [Spirochaetales bacterium]